MSNLIAYSYMGCMILSVKQYKNVTEGFHQSTKSTRKLLRDACVCSIRGFAWITGWSLLRTVTMAHDTWYNDYCILLGLSQYCQYNFEHTHRMEIALTIITGYFNKHNCQILCVMYSLHKRILGVLVRFCCILDTIGKHNNENIKCQGSSKV